MLQVTAKSEDDRSSACREAQLGRLTGRLARLYRLWLRLALVLLALSLVLDLMDDRRLEGATVPLTALPHQLGRGDPAAFASLALLFGAVGPIFGLLLVLATCARWGDRRTALLAAVVVLVISILPIARTVGGR